MRSELNMPENEILDSADFSMPEEMLGAAAEELCFPAAEVASCAEEFVGTESEETATEEQQTGKNRKSRSKLMRKMGYLVAGAVATVTIANAAMGGDITDNVVRYGGSVDGDLRFTIQWNDIGENLNDFDAHCIEPSGFEIYYGTRGMVSPDGGDLDVDIVYPEGFVAIENIVYAHKEDMADGEYILAVHNFSHNGGTNGFCGEIEILDKTYRFKYRHNMDHGETVVIAKVTLANGNFNIDWKI